MLSQEKKDGKSNRKNDYRFKYSLNILIRASLPYIDVNIQTVNKNVNIYEKLIKNDNIISSSIINVAIISV